MTPRERMRLRKLQTADEKAGRLRYTRMHAHAHAHTHTHTHTHTYIGLGIEKRYHYGTGSRTTDTYGTV